MINKRKFLSILGLGSLLPGALIGQPTQQEIKAEQLSSLDAWKNQTRQLVQQSNDPRTIQLIEAANHNQPIAFYYFGGSSPRQLRLASIESVFRLPDSSHTYVTAYCHLRREHRTFRADKLSLA